MCNKGIRFLVKKVLLTAFSVLCLLPVGFAVVQALQYGGQFSFRQFEEILLYHKEFFAWFWNSVLYATAILAIQLPLSALAGYAFAQSRGRLMGAVFTLYIFVMILPFQATLVPQYLALHRMGCSNTPWAVILPNAVGAFGPVLIAQYIRGIDPDILNAARSEGATEWQIFLRFILPMCRPAFTALAVLSFFMNWSCIDQVLLFVQDSRLSTLALELSGQHFGAVRYAADVVYAILPLLVYCSCRDGLERGICLSNIL